MFGPNATTALAPYMHHREPCYRALLQETRELFYDRLAVPKDHRLLCLTGSGTLALEAVLHSLPRSVHVYGSHEQEFGARLWRLVVANSSYASSADAQVAAWVQYETAVSRLQTGPWPLGESLRVVDAVSAFPYYDLPEVDAWVTVSSKQLGAAPVLGIVGLSPRAVEAVHRTATRDSYLSLRRWLKADAQNESPHSPAIDLVWDLREKLRTFNTMRFRGLVDSRRRDLVAALPAGSVMGDGPVVSIRRGVLPSSLCTQWQLYQHHDQVQIFLWATGPFERFVTEVKACAVPLYNSVAE